MLTKEKYINYKIQLSFVVSLIEPEEGKNCGKNLFWCKALEKCMFVWKKPSCPGSDIEDNGGKFILVSY